MLNRVLLQLEAEEMADLLNDAFDHDHAAGKLERIPELIRQFRAGHGYA